MDRLHAVSEGCGRGRVHCNIRSNEAMADAGAPANLVDGLVCGVENYTGAKLSGKAHLFFSCELPLPNLFGQAGVEERVGSR